MLTTVAAETGPDVFTLARWPLWRVMYCYYHIEERRQREALMRRAERVDLGIMVSHAMNKPGNLLDERRAVQDAIAALDRPPVPVDPRERGLALVTRIESGRVLSPDALLS